MNTFPTILIFNITFVIICLQILGSFGQPLDVITDENDVTKVVFETKCNDTQLREASDEYENCHKIALNAMKDKRAQDKQTNEILKKPAKLDPR